MKRLFNDWTVNVESVETDDYGKGFVATAYIAKLDGTKACVHTFGCYGDKRITTHTDMYNYVKHILDEL